MNEFFGYVLLFVLASCDAGKVDHRNDISPQQQFAFETMDFDNNGEINLAEWNKEVYLTAGEIAATNKQQSIEYKERMLNLFTELDTNHDSTLSKSELIQPQ